MRNTRSNVTPDVTLSLRWDDTTKTWRLLAQNREGAVLGREIADTTAAVDRHAALALLRAVRRELEMFLPF